VRGATAVFRDAYVVTEPREQNTHGKNTRRGGARGDPRRVLGRAVGARRLGVSTAAKHDLSGEACPETARAVVCVSMRCYNNFFHLLSRRQLESFLE
jgi:hypothetical protein